MNESKRKPLRALSLFSGIGGFDLGFERAGMRIVGQCEADPAARRVLERHWPGVPLSEDVRTVDREWLGGNGLRAKHSGRGSVYRGKRGGGPCGGAGGTTWDEADELPIDLVCGGFPCQDLSVAGKRKGLAGERSGLFFEATRVADLVLGPGGWLVIENVPGLLSSNGGRDFAIVLATLAELGFHDLAWRVLDSRYFGVPQRRRRVFIVARRARGDRAKQVLLEPESGGGDFAPSQSAGAGFTEPSRQGFEVAGTVGNGSGKRGWKVSAEDAAGGHLQVAAKCLTTSQERQDFDTQDFVYPGLRSVGAFMAGQGAKAGSIAYEENVSPTLKGAASGTNRAPTIHDNGVRRLTPTECERLQGFPDGWTIPDGTDWREYPRPDGPRYAQMGNAVTVPVAEWIGRRLVAANK